MAKELAEVGAETRSSDMVETIRRVIGQACLQPGGLKISVNQRGGKPANEDLVFGPETVQDVFMRDDCMVVVILMSGCRYWPSNKASNCEVVKAALHSTGEEEGFQFPEGVKFSGSVLEEAHAQETTALAMA